MSTLHSPPQHKVISKQEMKKLISKNLLISVIVKVLNLLIRVFIVPLTLSFVSLEEYGLWAICFILVSYLSLGAFGISNVYVRYVAVYHATDEIEKINGLVSTGIILVTTISLLLLLILWFFMPELIENTFRISPHYHRTAYILFYGTACMFMLYLSLGAFEYVLNGLQKIAEASLIWVFCLILETILIIIFLFSGLGIYSLLYAFIIRYIVNFAICTFFSYKYLPGLSIGIAHFDRSYFRLFYRFGGIVQISGILSVILRSIDKLLATTQLHVQATALLDLGTKFPFMTTTVSGAMTAVYLPATSYMHSQERKQEVFDMYFRGLQITTMVIGFFMGFLTVFSYPLVVAWLGTDPKYEMVALIMMLSTFPTQMHTLTGPGTSYFKGIDKPALTLVYSGVRILLVLITAYVAFKFYEPTIITITVIVSITTVLGSLIFITHANHAIGLSQLTFFTKVLLSGAVPYIIAYLLWLALSPWNQIAMLSRMYAVSFVLVSGILYSVFTLLFFYWGMYDAEQRQQINQKVKSLLSPIFGRN